VLHENLIPENSHLSPSPAAFTLLVLIGVVVTKEAIFRMLSARAEAVGSRALQVDAWP
jgi:divalent metal cation (Fe/Co/Zn/Cd) transporter